MVTVSKKCELFLLITCLPQLTKLWYSALSFVGLGYHEDLQTRAVFMEVLTKILQQVWEDFDSGLIAKMSLIRVEIVFMFH